MGLKEGSGAFGSWSLSLPSLQAEWLPTIGEPGCWHGMGESAPGPTETPLDLQNEQSRGWEVWERELWLPKGQEVHEEITWGKDKKCLEG